MTQDDAFLQAIIENPDDDSLRLIYADWLDEHGQPERAEFIRVQCELARMPADDPRWGELESVERELLERHAGELLGPLNSPLLHWQFRRGLVQGFAHAGVFQRTEAVVDDRGRRVWSYCRFYGDGTVLLISTEETPPELPRWFRLARLYRRSPRPHRESEPPGGRYTMRQVPGAVELAFHLYAAGFGLLDFRGTVEVRPGPFGAGSDVVWPLEVYNHNEARSERQTYRLVEVPGCDWDTGP